MIPSPLSHLSVSDQISMGLIPASISTLAFGGLRSYSERDLAGLGNGIGDGSEVAFASCESL